MHKFKSYLSKFTLQPFYLQETYNVCFQTQQIFVKRGFRTLLPRNIMDLFLQKESSCRFCRLQPNTWPHACDWSFGAALQ